MDSKLSTEKSTLNRLVREKYDQIVEVLSQPEMLDTLTSKFYEANLLPKELKDAVHHTVGLSTRQKACKVLDAVESISNNSLKNFLHFIRILKSHGYTEHLGSALLQQLQGKLWEKKHLNFVASHTLSHYPMGRIPFVNDLDKALNLVSLATPLTQIRRDLVTVI